MLQLRRFLFGILAAICLLLIATYYNFHEVDSPQKLIFVDRGCYNAEADVSDTKNFWDKLLLMNQIFRAARISSRTLLIITCPSTRFQEQSPMQLFSWCDMYAASEFVVCKKLQQAQLNPHINRCLSGERDGLKVLLDRKSNIKKRVYICEENPSIFKAKLPEVHDILQDEGQSMEALQLNLSSSLNYYHSNQLWEKIIPVPLSFSSIPSLSVRLLAHESVETSGLSKGIQIVTSLSPDGSILFQMYHDTLLLKQPVDFSDTSFNILILYILLNARWLHLDMGPTSTTMDGIPFLIEELRYQNGKTFCSAYIDSIFEGKYSHAYLKQNRLSKYLLWCENNIKPYLQSQPFAMEKADSLLWYKPKLEALHMEQMSHEASPAYDGASRNKPDRSGFRLWLSQKFILFQLRFLTRPFFRYQIIGWGSLVLSIALIASRYFVTSRKQFPR